MLTLVLGWTCARVQAADRSLILQLIHEHVLEPQFISNGWCLGETHVDTSIPTSTLALRYCPCSNYPRIYQTVCSCSLIHTSWRSCGRSWHNLAVSLQLWQGSAKGETGQFPRWMRSVTSSTSWKPGRWWLAGLNNMASLRRGPPVLPQVHLCWAQNALKRHST